MAERVAGKRRADLARPRRGPFALNMVKYDLHDYDAMLADPERTQAYLAAIAAAVRPGDVVVEIGTGAGFFAVAAARAGARRVYAIECSDVADVARELVADNGYADIVEVLHGDALTLSLPERGDVLIEDLRGVLPTFSHRFAIIADARARHLVPHARLTVLRDTLWAAPCQTLASDASLGEMPYGISRRAVARRIRDVWWRVRLGASDQLAAPRELARIDLETVSTPNVAGDVQWTIEHRGLMEGIAVWFDAEMAGGAAISNAPAAPRALYGQALFPLTTALPVSPGDRVHVAWRALLVGETYVYSWDTTHESAVDGRATAFRQSSLAELLPARAVREQEARRANDSTGHRHA